MFPKMPEEDNVFFLLEKSCLELDQEGKATEAFNKIVDEYAKNLYYRETKGILD
jgi:hypothetical protein